MTKNSFLKAVLGFAFVALMLWAVAPSPLAPVSEALAMGDGGGGGSDDSNIFGGDPRPKKPRKGSKDKKPKKEKILKPLNFKDAFLYGDISRRDKSLAKKILKKLNGIERKYLNKDDRRSRINKQKARLRYLEKQRSRIAKQHDRLKKGRFVKPKFLAGLKLTLKAIDKTIVIDRTALSRAVNSRK